MLVFAEHFLDTLKAAMMPQWASLKSPDAKHFYRRKFTDQYARKKRQVKHLWISALLLVLFFPTLPLLISMVMFTSFLSFCILDET